MTRGEQDQGRDGVLDRVAVADRGQCRSGSSRVIIAPSSAAFTKPRPPNRLVPPITRGGDGVVSYNADGGRCSRPAAYVGQDLLRSRGRDDRPHGSRPSCPRAIVLLHRDAGAAEHPAEGRRRADAIRDSAGRSRARGRAGADVPAERRKVEETYRAHKDLPACSPSTAASTQAVAYVMQRYRLHRQGVRAGGYDLLPGTLESVASGRLDFTIDQQPYLQGLLPHPAALPLPLLERPRLSGRHQYGPEVRDAAQRRGATSRPAAATRAARARAPTPSPPTPDLQARSLRRYGCAARSHPSDSIVSSKEPAMGRLKTSLGIWAFGSMVTRFNPGGYQPAAPRTRRRPSACTARSRASAT